MNKISILGLSAFMAFGFAACDGYEEPNPAPQTNEQESIVKPGEVSFTESLGASDVADLRALNDAAEPLTIATVTGVIPEGYDFVVKAEISADGGSNWFAVPTEAVAAEGQENTYDVNVAPDVLDGLYIENVTKDPATVSVDARYKLYTQTGGMLGLVDVAGSQGWITGNTFELKPFGPGYIIENDYYLVLNGNVANAIKMDHDDSVSPNRYDNAVFSTVVELAGATTWQVVPASTFAAGSLSNDPYAVWGVKADAEPGLLSGSLVPATAEEAATAGSLDDNAPYKLTVNLYDRTFEWSMALVNIYCTGTHNKNNPNDAVPMGTTDYANYYAYINLVGTYRFLGQTSNKGLFWGYDADNAGMMIAQGPKAFPAVKAFSFVEANIVKLTTKVTPVTSFGIIGDATPGGWDAETPMTMVAGSNGSQWECDVTLGAGEFKFRANNGWDVNLGGSIESLVQNGNNIAATPGNYHMVLYLDTYPAAAVLTAN